MSSWNPFSYPPSAVLKTIYGFLLPGVVALGAAFARAAVDATHPVTKADYIAALVAMFVTGGAVFGAKNKDVPVDDNEGGYTSLSLVFLIVGVLLLALAILALLKVLAISLAWVILMVIAGFLLIFFAHR